MKINRIDITLLLGVNVPIYRVKFYQRTYRRQQINVSNLINVFNNNILSDTYDNKSEIQT